MAFRVPDFEVGEHIQNVKFREGASFAPIRWVPALVELGEARTCEELRESLGKAAFYKGGHTGHMRLRGRNGTRTKVGPGEARFKFTNDEQTSAHLTYFNLQSFSAHFQTPMKKLLILLLWFLRLQMGWVKQ